jgi:hypothetical protein
MLDKKPLQTIWNVDTNQWEMYISMKQKNSLGNFPLDNINSLTKPIPELATIIRNPTYRKFISREIEAKKNASRTPVNNKYPKEALATRTHDRGYHGLLILTALSSLVTLVGLALAFVRSIEGLTPTSSGSNNFMGNYTLGGNNTFTAELTSNTPAQSNTSSIATASVGFFFAALGAVVGFFSYAGTIYINDRNKQEQNQFTNLVDDKERLPIIQQEIKLKDTVIDFLLNVLVKLQANQSDKKTELRRDCYADIAQGIDSFDDLNAYSNIKSTLEAIRAKQYLGNNNYLDIVLALVKAEFSALYVDDLTGVNFRNFINSFNNASNFYDLLLAFKQHSLGNYYIDIFTLLAKHLQNKDKLLALDELIKITQMSKDAHIGQHTDLLIKYISDKLPEDMDYAALSQSLENLGDNQVGFVNEMKNKLNINDNNVSNLHSLLQYIKQQDLNNHVEESSLVDIFQVLKLYSSQPNIYQSFML